MFFKPQNLKIVFFCAFFFSFHFIFSQTFTDNIPGAGTFIVPCGVTSITVEAWGAGGGGQRVQGNPSAGGGGSGGGYVKTTIFVTSGNTYNYFIGTGGSGNSGVNGTSTWFVNNSTINTVGGRRAGFAITSNNSWGSGASAFTTGNIGGTLVSAYGGNGGNAGNNFSGGGGSSAGSTLSNNALGIVGGIAPTDGYAGATGRSNNGVGATGNIGAGGAGGRTNNWRDKSGGNGGNGQIRISYTSAFQTYCSPTFTNGVEPITNVTFAGINNTTNNTLGGANLESFCDIGTVVQGTTHEISLQGNTDGNYTDYFRVYVDWDQNGTYGNNANEIYNIGTISNSTGIDGLVLIGDIAVPATATLGSTRMRVMKKYGNYSTTSCEDGLWGQVEDYTINITSPTDTYCTSYGNTDYNTGITLVSFSTINNATGPLKTNGYEDFTSLSTNVILGSSHNLTVHVNTDGDYTNSTFVWIDWNQDGDFDDVGESYDLGIATNVSDGATANSPLTITIPATASIGSTRMRVSTRYFNNPIPCGAGFDGEVEDYTINIINTSNIWNGSLSSDWNVPGNWSVGVPTSGVPNTLNVLIPTGLTNYPIIYAADSGGYTQNVEFEIGSSLTILDNSIEITGTLLLSGIIDLQGESQLLQNTGSILDPSSTGSIEIDQQGEGNSFRYNYWSSPVNSAGANYTIGGVLKDGTDSNNIEAINFGKPYAFADGAITSPIKLSTYWMYKLQDSGLGYSAWFHVGNTGEILVGEGFTMKGSNTTSAEQNYTFVGKPNNGTISLPISANNEYLVGNPYPSAIDAYQFIDDNSPLGTASIGNGGALIFWEHYGGDSHNLVDYQGGYAILTKANAVPASSNVPAGVSTLGSSVKGAPGQYIPVGQAFFVTGSSTGGNIQFNNGQRIFEKEAAGVSVFMKNSTAKSKIVTANKTDLRPKFRIGFDAPAINHRQLLLTIDKNTTDAVDWGYDAEIYDIINDDMYWIIDTKKYVIQATNTFNLDKEIPLGIETKEGGNIRIMVDALENVPENTSIYIKDNLTGETYDITNQAFEINLEAGEYQERFILAFQPRVKTLEEVALVEGVHIFMNNTISELQLNKIVDTEIESVSVFNYLGQQMNAWNLETNERLISLPIQITTGVYIVRINTTAGIITKKIIIE